MSNYIDGLVSVIIPTYKRSDMLTRAIDSVLNQSYHEIELIVVNDNEKNDEYSVILYDILEKYKHDSRFIFLEQEKHINGAVARNYGIKHAHGEFIAFLDDDDIWDLYKLEIQVKALTELDHSWGAVSCLKKYYKNNKCYRASIPYKDGYIFTNVLMFLTNITTGTILIRRETLDQSGYFDESLLRQQDIQLFSCLSKISKIKLIRKYLLNIDIGDSQNRPKLEQYMQIKEAYIKSVSHLFDSKKMEMTLRKHIAFSYGIMLLKSKRISGVKWVLSSFSSPSVVLSEIKYYFTNIREVLFKQYYLRKYK